MKGQTSPLEGIVLSLRKYCPLWVKTLTDLLNPILGRDASYPQHISMSSHVRCTTHVIMWAHAYMLQVGGVSLRVGGVSLQCGIEQIHEGFHPKWTIPSKGEIRPSIVIMHIFEEKKIHLLMIYWFTRINSFWLYVFFFFLDICAQFDYTFWKKKLKII